MAEEIEEQVRNYNPVELRDCFGRPSGIQLGVPSGKNSHRLYDVQPTLALAVIKAHAATKRSELMALNEVAKQESQT